MLMMLPFEAPTIFEGIHKSYFQMPRVVKNQRHKFENEELFRQLSHESTVRYTGFKDRPLEERQMKFLGNCHEGHTEVSVIQSGIQFTLMFNPTANPAFNSEGCDFDKEQGKVHIKSGFILDGVCVIWRGWIDLQRLEGFGCLLFDDYRAYLEDEMLKQKSSCNNNVGHPNNFHHMLPNPLPTLGLPDAPSLAGPSIAYGKSAIAAAAAAAFHQALGVGPPPQLQLQQQQQQQQQLPPPPRTLGPQALQRLGPASAAAVNSGPMTGVLPN